jgi:NAD(P)-dependent dehydrogenase (short-subunit alcohol dehydrogenase family)
MRLKDKVAIVTGAASGIGRAIALALGREGASVVVDDIDLGPAETVADEVRKLGAKALAIKADVSKEGEVKQMVERTVAEFGRVDILVNNAAAGESGLNLFHETEAADWETHIDSILKGMLHCCRAVIPHMIEHKGGRIINIASAITRVGVERMAVYSGCKGAVPSFSRSIAVELGRHGILVNCVSPGITRTPPLLRYLEVLPDLTKHWQSGIPLQRLGEPEDIADIVVFLASDKSKYITGQDFAVDGGSTIYTGST